MRNKNILAVRNLIRCLDLASLRNPEVVANLVRAFGIVHWGPPVFGKDEVFKNASEDMAGIYQTPDQLGKALVYLSKFEIASYLEVGVFQGGNFLFVSEYLKRFNPRLSALGIDPTGYLNPEIAEAIGEEAWIHFSPCASDDLAGMDYDLVFIDGDHSLAWVERDWRNVGRHARICMIHDIQETSCPAVVGFWKTLKDREERSVEGLRPFFQEFLDHSSPVPLQGIGIIHNANIPVTP